MNPTSIKWLIAGLAGALFSLALMGGASYFAFTTLLSEINDHPSWGAEDSPEDAEEDAAEAERRERKREEERREQEALTEKLGLRDHYETVYLLPDTRNRLYYDKNFAAVEEDIAALRAKQDTPFDRYRYSSLINSLGRVLKDEEYPQLLSVLDEWIAASSGSYLPLLVRGRVYVSIAWKYRGTDFAHKVTEEGWEGYRKYHKLAWADLNAARKLNQEDPEIPASMARAAAGVGKKLAAIQKYHDETLALNPHHLHVRNTLLNYSLPQWFGDWKKVDALVAEFEQAAGDFPYLLTLLRDAARWMRDRGPDYEEGPDSDHIRQRLVEGLRAQLMLNPDEPYLLGRAARFALDANDLAMAVDCFERLGMRHPSVRGFINVYTFHWWRVYAFVEHSDDPGIIGTPREKELLDLARAIQADNPFINGMYLAYLARARDDAQTRAFFERDPGAFFQTADLEEPYDYDLLRAMALAARSHNPAVQGTPEVERLLAEALDLAPDNALVRLAEAARLMASKDYEQARPHLEHARSVDPDYLPALMTEGWLNYHQKRWDDGIAAANAFLARAPAPYVLENASHAEEIIALCEKKRAAEQQNAT